MWTRDHPTLVCPEHKTPLVVTISKTQAVCRTCDYYELLDTALPKPIARAIRQLRKRTRKMLRRRSDGG